jgi:hypothetical protein
MDAFTRFLGCWNLAMGTLLVTSRTNACHRGAAAVNDIAGFLARGIE